jgi:hypothetical protein
MRNRISSPRKESYSWRHPTTSAHTCRRINKTVVSYAHRNWLETNVWRHSARQISWRATWLRRRVTGPIEEGIERVSVVSYLLFKCHIAFNSGSIIHVSKGDISGVTTDRVVLIGWQYLPTPRVWWCANIQKIPLRVSEHPNVGRPREQAEDRYNARHRSAKPLRQRYRIFFVVRN